MVGLKLANFYFDDRHAVDNHFSTLKSGRNMTTQNILREAMDKHKAGDIASAEMLYKQILASHPFDADALNLLGVLSLQRGCLDEAQNLLKRAIGANPRIAEFHNNLGQVLKQQGLNDAAMASFRKSLQLNPDLTIAKNNLEAMPGDKSSSMMPNHAPMKRYEVVQQVLDNIHGRTYLEIGIDTAEAFVKIRAERKFGIDPVPTFNLINQMLSIFDIGYFRYSGAGDTNSAELMIEAKADHSVAQLTRRETAEFYYMTSDKFFEEHAPRLFRTAPIDAVLVDGLHTYEQTYQDVLNTLDYLHDNGVILMHDCNPASRSSAFPAASWEAAAQKQLPGWNGLWCGDVWKTVAHLRATRNDLNVFVLDCDFGIGVVSRGKPESMLSLSEARIRSLTYDDLLSDRQSLINLKPQEYLYEFLTTVA